MDSIPFLCCYLELKRRYPEVSVGQYGADGEVDFVAIQDGAPVYYQVAQTTLDEQVLTRELAPLRQIRDNHPKYLLTLDEAFGEMNYDGIEKKQCFKVDAGADERIIVKRNKKSAPGGICSVPRSIPSQTTKLDIPASAVGTPFRSANRFWRI